MAEERRFPLLQEYRGHQLSSIPWALAEKAYQCYAARYGTRQSLERLAERGGFGPSELDDLYPAWREELAALQQEANARAARID